MKILLASVVRRFLGLVLSVILFAAVFVWDIPSSFAEEPPAESPSAVPMETAGPEPTETPGETPIPSEEPTVEPEPTWTPQSEPAETPIPEPVPTPAPSPEPDITPSLDAFGKAKTLYELYGARAAFETQAFLKQCATSGDYDYAVNPNGVSVTITGYHGTGGDIRIPDALDGKAVTAIGEGAFFECDTLTSTIVPDSVASIGMLAFYLCDSLTSVTFGNGLNSIGDYAFEMSGLTNVTLSAGVAAIGTDVFGSCIDLTAINVDGANPNYMSENGILFNKAKTVLIQYPAGKAGTAYNVPSGVSVLTEGAFEACFNLTNIALPNSLSRIDEGAFAFCFALGTINIPAGVTRINDLTFYECESLQDIQLANGIESIGMGAFYDCISLTTIQIPASMVHIDDFAFQECRNLGETYFMGDAPSVGEKAFPDSWPFFAYYRSDRVGFSINMNSYARNWCNPWETAPYSNLGYLRTNGDYDYWVSEGQVTIVKYHGSTNVIKIPSVLDGCPVTAVGQGAFLRNPIIADVTIPGSVQIIGRDALAYCNLLTRVDIHEGTKCIGENAFQYCLFMKSVNLPASLTIIEGGTFVCNQILSDITIPENVAYIGSQAFCQCRALSKAYFLGDAPILAYDTAPIFGPSNIFNDCSPNFKAYYLNGKSGFTNMWHGNQTALFNPSGVYTVIFDPANMQPVIKTSVSYGAMVNPPASPTRRDCEFVGWSLNNGISCVTEFPYQVKNDTTLTAKFIPIMTEIWDVSLSAGTLSGVFSPYKYKYKIALGEYESSVQITPKKGYHGAVMTINGKAASSTTVSLANGKSKTVTIKVKYGKKSTTYKFTVTRAKSGDNNLASLTNSAGAMSQPFDPNVTNYTLSLDENTKSVMLKATRSNTMAKVSPASKKLTLKSGQTKMVKFTVKAQSGAKKTYTVTVTRAPSTNTNLKTLKAGMPISPGFNAGVTDYTVTLPADKESITISAKVFDRLSKVTIDGLKKSSKKVTLANGQSTTVSVVVTSQAGTTKEYRVLVQRP